MFSHNNTKHRQETLADMWAQGEAAKEFSRSWTSAMQPLLYFLLLFWSYPALVCFCLFFQAVNSFCVGPISCYQFSSDQPFIPRWLPEEELPALVAGP